MNTHTESISPSCTAHGRQQHAAHPAPIPTPTPASTPPTHAMARLAWGFSAVFVVVGVCLCGVSAASCVWWCCVVVSCMPPTLDILTSRLVGLFSCGAKSCCILRMQRAVVPCPLTVIDCSYMRSCCHTRACTLLTLGRLTTSRCSA